MGRLQPVAVLGFRERGAQIQDKTVLIQSIVILVNEGYLSKKEKVRQ